GFGVETHPIGESGTAALLDEQSQPGDIGVHILAVEEVEGVLGGILRNVDLGRRIARFSRTHDVWFRREAVNPNAPLFYSSGCARSFQSLAHHSSQKPGLKKPLTRAFGARSR